VNLGGMDRCTAEADYQGEAREDGEPTAGFHTKLLDLGNASGMMAAGYTSWALMQSSSETETGYEKSIEYEGFPGMESYDREGQYGSMQVLVGKRSTVEIQGHDATIEQIRAALDLIDLAKPGALGK